MTFLRHIRRAEGCLVAVTAVVSAAILLGGSRCEAVGPFLERQEIINVPDRLADIFKQWTSTYARFPNQPQPDLSTQHCALYADDQAGAEQVHIQ
eukprot:scaffold80782_cov40-Prasinocladus_malaysianus.AAC.1